jgi:hypothetical protein
VIDLSYVLTAEMLANSLTLQLPKPAVFSQCAMMIMSSIVVRNELRLCVHGHGEGMRDGIGHGEGMPS